MKKNAKDCYKVLESQRQRIIRTNLGENYKWLFSMSPNEFFLFWALYNRGSVPFDNYSVYRFE